MTHDNRTSDPTESDLSVHDAADRVWWLAREVETRRALNIEYRDALAEAEKRLDGLRAEIAELRAIVDGHEARRAQLEGSVGWALLGRLQQLRARALPPGSARDRRVESLWRWWRTRNSLAGYEDRLMTVEPVHERPPVEAHRDAVAIIVCVHNALEDVGRCLDSVLEHTSPPYRLILVDDGSDAETAAHLTRFAKRNHATLFRNEVARGYTRAANQGLAAADEPWLLLLNSDTIVTPGWLDRLVACAESDRRIGIVGPLSNTASWQSVPAIEENGDWAANPLPSGMTVGDMGALLATYAARLYPRVPFLNGFCLLIRRELLDAIGPFDEESFGPGYGEENDFALRARAAGWSLAIADDAYVYHAQSRSYTSEKRLRLAQDAGQRLVAKHGQAVVGAGVAICRGSRVLEGMRARARAMLARRDWIAKGRERFAGARLVFVLPVSHPGGGANVVIDEALAMRAMGVEVSIYNLLANRVAFERTYAAMPLPVRYGRIEDLAEASSGYDAVVATFNPSVAWLAPLGDLPRPPVRGYYVQDFEPLMYREGTPDHERALRSYNLFPDLVRFTKTEWTRTQVREQIGVDCTVVGPSVNIDLFRPRPTDRQDGAGGPLRLAAMVRPGSPYREPGLTMEVLQRAARRYGDRVEIIIFGTTLEDPECARLPHRFPWRLAGVLSQRQVARLMSEVDVFVDLSSHQAMGLTALEAMACGVATIVPCNGGATSFARHMVNSLVVDTASTAQCWRALKRLIEQTDLRERLRRQALVDVCEFYPERAAYYILEALLGAPGGRRHD